MPRIATTDLARALADRHQLAGRPAVPAHPALRPELALRREPDALWLDGAEPTKLTGKRTLAALDRLLPLLDGRRDHQTLAADAQLPDAAVQQLLAVLGLRAALQEGPVTTDDPTTRYLSRAVARTGWHDRADQASAALRRSRVRLVGASPLVDLVRAGLGGLVTVGPAAGPVGLICHLDHGVGVIHNHQLEAGQTPILPVRVAGSLLLCGPYLAPDGPVCARCAGAEIDALLSGDPTAAADPGVLAGLVVSEILHLLGGIGRGVTPGTIVRHDLTRWRTEVFDVVGRPACDCGVNSNSVEAELVVRYEAATALPERRWLPPALDREHYRPGHLAAQHRFNRAPGPSMPPGEIGALLRQAVGLRQPPNPGEAPDRWAPSAGNLGSVVGYWADGDGVAQYDPRSHELVRLSATAVENCLVFTADLTKLMPKYGAKSYRLGYLEAGAALAQLALAAGEQGFGVRATALADQTWARRLDSDRRGELLCLSATVTRSFGAASTGSGSLEMVPSGTSGATTSEPVPSGPIEPVPSGPIEPVPSGPISRTQIGAELARAVRAQSVRAEPVQASSADGQTGPTQPFPTLVSAASRVARRSRRDFARAPISTSALTSVIENSLTVQAELWPGADMLQPVVLAARTTGGPSGVLRYRAGQLQSTGPLPAETDLIWQPELAEAAAIVIWFTDLAETVGRSGVSGYRNALIQCGAAAATAALSAADHGLSSCLFDGLLPAGRQCGAIGADRRQLALGALALGVAADRSKGDRP